MRTCSYCGRDLDTVALHEHMVNCKDLNEICYEQLQEIFSD